jgi:hypothetical protein
MAHAPIPLEPIAPAVPRLWSWERVRYPLRWIAWSLPALPIAVLVHELGHLFWLKVFGFPGVQLHFAAATNALEKPFWNLIREGDPGAAAQLVSFTQFGIATFTGILISYATIIWAAWYTTKRRVHPLVVAVGLVATLRFRLGYSVSKRLLFTDNHVPSGTDEGLVGAVSGVPELLLWIVGLTIVVAGWFFIIRGLPRGKRLAHFGLVALGTIAGAVVYIAWLGPWLLP